MKLIRHLIYIAITALSAYFASNDEILIWLVNNSVLSQKLNIELFQDICLLVNIGFTVFVINGELILYRIKDEQHRKEIAGLYNVVKQFALSNFCSITKNDNFSFDLRIFVPEFSIWKSIKGVCRRKKEKWFVIRNIEPFAKKDITENLRFRVEPADESQGLVGDAYNKGSIVYDSDLSSTNSVQYALDQSQLNRTNMLRWSICVPILDVNNSVVAIMAFDSDSSDLDISKNKNEIKNLTNTLAIMMQDSVPELFKRKVTFK